MPAVPGSKRRREWCPEGGGVARRRFGRGTAEKAGGSLRHQSAPPDSGDPGRRVGSQGWNVRRLLMSDCGRPGRGGLVLGP